jgi:hypothetical protein
MSNRTTRRAMHTHRLSTIQPSEEEDISDFESILKHKKPFLFFKYIFHLFEQQVKSMKQVNNESTRLKHQDTYDDVF